MKDDDATWVGGGGFKVDRKKALEKLAAYALTDGRLFLRTWLRAAVANEATRIDVRSDKNGLEMEFDGRGFTYDQLKDPYGVLFEKERPRTEDRRYLAVGILTAFAAEPGAVDLFYGAPEKRFKTTLSKAAGEKTTRVNEATRNTRLRVVSLERSEPWRAAAAEIPTAAALCPARVFIDGKEIERLPRGAEEPGAWIEEPGFRAWLSLPRDAHPGSAVVLSVDGVLLDELRMHDHDVRVYARVDAHDVTLNAGHAKIVKNDRYRALSGKIQDASGRLVELAGKRLAGDFDRDDWNARAARWLRDLTDRLLLDPEHDADDPLKRTLWNCPLYRTVGKEAVSLADIRNRERKDGKVRCIVARLRPRDDGSGALWCRDREEFNSLVARFALEDL